VMIIRPWRPQNLPFELAQLATPAPSPGPLKELGTLFSMAQEVRWLDDQRFAVGRWDGTLTVFNFPNVAAPNPSITSAAVSPAFNGVEMIVDISPMIFASSCDGSSIALWEKNSIQVCTGIPVHKVAYDPSVGIANSGTLVTSAGKSFLLTGHAEGYVLIWEVKIAPDTLNLVKMVATKSPNPIPSPYQLWNVREIAPVSDGVALFGSEGGDVCFITVPDGVIRSRTRYNPSAQRGINNLSVLGDYLAVANCSVGSNDKNLWLYRIKGFDIALLDSKDLKVDPSSPQAFNFDVELAWQGNRTVYFSATQEGLLWVGDVQNDKLADGSKVPISSNFGAALNYQPSRGLLAVAGDNIHLYQLA
jgi:hypothetical protein